MSRRLVWIVCLLVGLLIGIAAWWNRDGGSAASASGPGSAAAPSGEKAGGPPTSVPPPHASPFPAGPASILPAFPAGTPVRVLRASLQAAAQAGNVGAQCRLGAELARCAAVFEAAASMEDQVGDSAMLPSSSPEALARSRSLAHARAELAPRERICEGITLEEARQGWRLVHRAARSGHLPSMLAFAITPPLSEANFSSQLDGWQAYRSDAVHFLLEAARRGSPRAMNQLAWVYGNLPVPGGSPLVERDIGRAMAYARVAADLADMRSRAQLQRLSARWLREASPEQIRRAASLETDLRARLTPSADDGADFIDAAIPSPEECDKP